MQSAACSLQEGRRKISLEEEASREPSSARNLSFRRQIPELLQMERGPS